MLIGLCIWAKIRPFAYFSCDSMTSGELLTILWTAVSKLTMLDFDIECFCMDGAAVNRALIKMCQNDGDKSKNIM